MTNINRLIERWNNHGVVCSPGATIADIEAFERNHNVILPSDMREYFLAVNGMCEYTWCDDDLFSFWPLQDLRTIAEKLPDRCSAFPDASRCFMFADHSISLPTFAIRLSADAEAPSPVASVFSDFGAFRVQYLFDSFTDFVNNYLDDPVETGQALPM